MPAERNESPGKISALVLTILVHLALVAFLVIGIRWQHQSAAGDGPMEVTLVAPPAAAPQSSRPAPNKQVAPKPKPPKPAPEPPKPEPKPEPPKVTPPSEPPKQAEKPADIALKKDESKKQQPKPEPKKEPPKPEPKKEEPKKTPPKKEEKPKHPEKSAKPAKPAVSEDDYLAQMLNAESKAASKNASAAADAAKAANALNGASSSAGGGSRGTNTDPGYADRIRQVIRSNLLLPPGVSGNPEARVLVTQSPAGRVLSVRITRSTGDAALDAAIDRAIRKSDPLPRPASGEVARELNLTFRPLE